MSSGIGLVLVVALLCAAGGLLLWQRAKDNLERALTDLFVDRRVASLQGATPGATPVATAGVAPAQNSQRTRSAAAAAISPNAEHGGREHLRHLQARFLCAFDNLMNRAGIASPAKLLWTACVIILPGACLVGLRAHWILGLGFLVFGVLCLFAFVMARTETPSAHLAPVARISRWHRAPHHDRQQRTGRVPGCRDDHRRAVARLPRPGLTHVALGRGNRCGAETCGLDVSRARAGGGRLGAAYLGEVRRPLRRDAGPHGCNDAR